MITTIINYCTNDYRFLAPCIREAQKFSAQVMVVVSDHFFDGTCEDRHLLNMSYHNHPDVIFLEYSYEEMPYGIYTSLTKDDPNWIHYCHSTSRYLGYHFAPLTSSYLLFLDVDEIVEGEAFKKWLSHFPYQNYEAIRFVCYFYFRSSSMRAKKEMRCGLLVRKNALKGEYLLDIDERRGAFDQLEGQKLEDVRSLEGAPLFHHYSWVKTKTEMEKKVRSWGHHRDRNWQEAIDKEFMAPEPLKDPFWGLEYENVQPFYTFNFDLPMRTNHQDKLSHVYKVNRREVLQRTLDSFAP